jgi:hypothetical protein
MMSGAGGGGHDNASKKPRLSDTDNESEHIVSIMQMVRRATEILRTFLILVVTTQGGNKVCQITCSSSTSILQLKAKVEVEAGLLAATLSIYLPEVDRPLGQTTTLMDCSLPSKLYVITLHKVVIAEIMGVSPKQLKDAQLAEACLTAEGKAGDIVCLAGCGALRDMSCLVQLEQMQELDISRCNGIDDNGTDATTIAKVIADHQALSKLIFGGDGYDIQYDPVVPATLELGMTEAEFSGKNLRAGGGIIIAAWITHKDRGALTSLNLSSNDLALAKSNASNMSGIIALTNILPNMGALTVLDLANNSLGEMVLPGGWTNRQAPEPEFEPNRSEEEFDAHGPSEYNAHGPGEWYEHTDGMEQKEHPGKPEGIVALANVIPDMEALSVLSLKSNNIATKEAGKALAQALAANSTLKELDVSSNMWEDEYGHKRGDGPGFARELAVGIKDNGTLLSLNLASNYIGGSYNQMTEAFTAAPEGRDFFLLHAAFCADSLSFFGL